jgi:uncharacterized membrane protein
MKFLSSYFFVVVSLLALDGVWIGVLAKGFYARQIGFLFNDKFNILPAALFYLCYAAGIVFFVLEPHEGTSLFKIFLIGAFLGLLAYGAYDFTNQATIKNWPLAVTVVDLLWGMVVTGTASVLAVVLKNIFIRS